MRFLVVEDEKDLNHIIAKTLRDAGYVVETCYDGKTALDYLLSDEVYDGVLLDVMIPEIDGFRVLEKVRRAGIETPALFLTAKDDTDDIVTGLDIGADDYIVKPFSFKELLARVRVMTRRKPEIQENVYRCMDLRVNYNTHEVKRGNSLINLSPKEFQVLLFLVRNKNIVVTREQIAENVWDIDAGGNSNVIDVYIRYLRRKIDDDFEYKMIQTVRGAGYILKCED